MESATPMRTAMASIGYGCTLGILSVSTSDLLSAYTGFAHLSDPWIYCTVLMLLVVAILLQGIARSETVLRALEILAIVFASTWALVSLVVFCGVAPSSAQPELSASSELLRRLTTIDLCILWNLHLSLTPDLELPKIASLATLLAMALFLLSTVAGTALLPLVATMVLVSIVLLAFMDRGLGSSGNEPVGETPLTTEGARENSPNGNLTCVKFFTSRIAWHLGLVAMVAFSYFDSRLAPSNSLVIALLSLVFVAVAGLVGVTEATKRSSISLAVLIPFIIAGGSLAGFLATPDAGVSRALSVVATMVWYMLLAIQLPSYLQLTKMGAMRFAILERTIPLVAVYAAYLALSLMQVDSTVADRPLGMLISEVFTTALSVFSIIAMVRHIWHYYPETAVQTKRADYEESLAGVVENLARSHALTPREKDVLDCLARGYSKRYAAKALCISMATVKTHAMSIYRKLDIGSRDELVDIIAGRSGR